MKAEAAQEQKVQVSELPEAGQATTKANLENQCRQQKNKFRDSQISAFIDFRQNVNKNIDFTKILA